MNNCIRSQALLLNGINTDRQTMELLKSSASGMFTVYVWKTLTVNDLQIHLSTMRLGDEPLMNGSKAKIAPSTVMVKSTIRESCRPDVFQASSDKNYPMKRTLSERKCCTDGNLLI
ncbi:hypothetical protein RB195_016434 [Necator americanus]|uniref:Uncharacterized protein n=1 Tax=Necator americanus TaxID=51031 RepID=A0ABR1C463_NECAM